MSSMRIHALCLATGLCLLTAPALAASSDPSNDDQKTLYALGLAISQSLGTFSLNETELDMVKHGITDGVLKRPQRSISKHLDQRSNCCNSLASRWSPKVKEGRRRILTKAASEKGATKTESGIVIAPIKPGSGATPKATDTVKVHYHGTLTDGTVFDSSIKRGEPATFPLDKVIKCWTEGVQQIKVGGKSRLVCPANLAYGDAGSPPVIKPGSTLVFEVELLEIVKN